MDSTGGALDNVYVERMWRSLKYEKIYLTEYHSMHEVRETVARYFRFHNHERFHQGLDYRTPKEVYNELFRTEGYEKAAPEKE